MMKNVPKKLRPLPSIPNADTFVQELNVLQLEGLLFDFSRKHADKARDIVEADDATGRSVRLNFDPRFGRPSILAYRVLQAIFRKLTQEGLPFAETVSFARHEIMQLAGRSARRRPTRARSLRGHPATAPHRHHLLDRQQIARRTQIDDVQSRQRCPILRASWLRTGVLVASVTASLATLIGLPVAVALRQLRGWLRGVVDGLFMSPLILPTIIIGIAMLQYFNRLGIGTTYWGLVLGHVVITTPYVIRLVGASLAAIDPRIELAARNLGAPPLTAFIRTTGQLALPGLVAGALFAFITSFDNVTISVFLTTPKLVTLPVRIYNLLDQPIYPWLVAICSMVIGITTALIIVIERTLGLVRVVGS